MDQSNMAGLVSIAVPAEWLKSEPRRRPSAGVTNDTTQGDPTVEVVKLSVPLATLIRGAGITVAGAGWEVLRRLVRLEVSGQGTLSVDTLESLVQAAETPTRADSLTAGQAAVLARAGSLVEELPPVGERASVRTKLKQRQLLSDALTTGEVAGLLGVGESRVRQRAANRSLLSVRAESGMRFPRFQFADDGEIPGWDQVAARFPIDAHPVAVERFMATSNVDLDLDGEPLSPWEWLASGGAAEVVANLVDDVYRLD